MKRYLKVRYVFDFLLAVILLPCCIPIFIIISLVQFFVFKDIIFTQQRSGLHGVVFTLFKFKTMKEGDDSKEEERIPGWGKFLRNTGLDELPQMLNIISGSMAFIGPRPLLPEYDKLYSIEQKKRLQIKPGITGYAQATNRNNTTWKERFELDIFYVKHAGLSLDLKIIYQSMLLIWSKNPQPILPKFNAEN